MIIFKFPICPKLYSISTAKDKRVRRPGQREGRSHMREQHNIERDLALLCGEGGLSHSHTHTYTHTNTRTHTDRYRRKAGH